MQFPISLLCVGLLGACVDGDLSMSSAEQEAQSYHPMGFARISASGGVVASFNSAGGAVTVSLLAVGSYEVDFAGLGTSSELDGSLGNAQVTAEGFGNIRCRADAWGSAGLFSSPSAGVSVDCVAPDGTPTNSPFAVVYVRGVMPATPNPWPTTAAYAQVAKWGDVGPLRWDLRWDFNSSGTHNSVTHPGVGSYVLTIPNAIGDNASIMVGSSEFLSPGNVCSLVSWSTPAATIECRSLTGSLIDSHFSFSYYATGPTVDQQGAHALFTGTSADPARSAALGKVSWCSPATITGTRSGSLATMIVAGDLGSWDGGVFRRASFANRQGAAGYCKVEWLTSRGRAPTYTGTTLIKCYSATGTVIATPIFRFTDVTNDATGPC